MIASIRGRLQLLDGEHAVVEVGGLGIEVLASGRTLGALSRRLGEEISLHTYLHVREDTLQLFGFRSVRERVFFQWLIGVSGVGPKVALAVLSGYPVEELELAVARDDVKKFESISGIGKKLAQRLVVELGDKVGQLPPAAGRRARRRRRPHADRRLPRRPFGPAEPRPQSARGGGGAPRRARGRAP